MTDTPPPIKTDIDFALRSVCALNCLYRFRDSCRDDNPEKRHFFSNTKCKARQDEKKIVLDKIGSFP
jgi:hypothetical protein